MGSPTHTEVTVARQSPQRPDADEPELDDTTGPAKPDATEPEAVAEPDPAEREADDESSDVEEADSAAAQASRALWDELRIDPIEVALPAGTGFTLRAYRPARELTPTDVAERDADDPFLARRQVVETDDEDDDVVILDEDVAREFAESDEDEKQDKDEESGKSASGKSTSKKDSDADEDADEKADDDGDEEVPVFLSHRGRLLLFKTPESLVSFVRSGAPNDMSQLDSWNELSERVEPADIAPLEEDVYELDLVVENLRGGHDSWAPTLLIEAGEVARDLSYALRLPAVLDMLSSGSSLDDLDDALRASVKGGIGGFLGRRKLKKIGAQTASLGWRTIVGKISAVVDWRD
ncbi:MULTISPECIES: DNA primase [unclassified Micromonospora]|uniref:DNA primase n=1 Tax=unclassified Micromonospora TaxID=2617518 RepID=UPI0010341306|nr:MULTISPECIES: DNA primase [unclassified Micromonospora]QKW12075.1 DNA primase [Verrucosispora sp. NA02020]TBL27313.1 DNA primase [Verrucosispora sp. SN26_14.1]